MHPPDPRAHNLLTRLIQRAHAGERAAHLAYLGHALADPASRDATLTIAAEELAHRRALALLLTDLRAAPDPRLERLFTGIGHLAALASRLFGPRLADYAAMCVERQNVREYRQAARLAHAAGLPSWSTHLLAMAATERSHQLHFQRKLPLNRSRSAPAPSHSTPRIPALEQRPPTTPDSPAPPPACNPQSR